MKIIRYPFETSVCLPPCVGTVGFFDGVHLGHRHLIGRVQERARSMGLISCVVTFAQHPRQVVQPGYRPQLLTTLDEKLALLDDMGIEECVVLHFDEHMAAMEAPRFMQTVLVDQLHMRRLVMGYDNHFGHGGNRGFADYAEAGRALGLEVEGCDAVDADGLRVCSSVVRQLITSGDVATAARCLGYPYRIEGEVVGGCRQGRRMGFPTANIAWREDGKLLPAPGVYAVRAHLGDGKELGAMMNIGTRPTFHGEAMTLEVHILHFTGNLYGQTLRVDLLQRLRNERWFENAEALAHQLEQDRESAEKWFDNNSEKQ